MLLTPEHRRSNRRRVKNKVFNLEHFINSNKVEKIPGKLYRREEKNVEVKEEKHEEEDIYSECPQYDGYNYDKDMYLGNDRYAKMVDNDIATLKVRESIRRSTYFSRKERFYDSFGNQI